MMEIKKFNELIEPNLKDGEELLSYECKYLLPPGENYGSVMLQISLKILNRKGEEEIIDCVGKMCPPSEFLWGLFNTKITFKKEIAVYNVIVPEINSFGKENGVDSLMNFFASSLGARISLNPKSNDVDKDALLLLENLKIQEYVIGDRIAGFDLECTKLLLADLAIMHASVIAYKIAKPEDFEKKILPHLDKAYFFNLEDDLIDDYIHSLQDAMGGCPNSTPYLPKIDKAVRKMRYFNENPPKGKEIFTTFAHTDYWVNNIMLKFENDKPVKHKMVDFQAVEYCSLAHDVIFLLYCSVNLSILENHIDELYQFYYDKFIHTLVTLKCDVSEYTFDIMMEEFKIIARDFEFCHILHRLPLILTLQGQAKDLDDFSLKDFVLNKNVVHDSYFRKMHFILVDFEKRGWI